MNPLDIIGKVGNYTVVDQNDPNFVPNERLDNVLLHFGIQPPSGRIGKLKIIDDLVTKEINNYIHMAINCKSTRIMQDISCFGF